MNQTDFLRALKKQNVINYTDYVSDYAELISDEADDKAISPEQVIAHLDDPKIIAAKIVAEDHPAMRPKLSKPMFILLLTIIILGAPLWAAILATLLILLLVAYILIWLLPFIAGVIGVSFTLVGSLATLVSIVAIFKASLAFGMTQSGFSLIITGIGILLLALTWHTAKRFSLTSVVFTKWLYRKFKGGTA
ncbi:DUF1700 domain-containing protein [Lactobacillus sp. CC-MHH1034]|uniref:HAAS domain-containing protein n=1 Tax=Agrilactobacillus fermenti TaxID=2586909 RepID=UPI001E4D703D|nr:DUF1700 domain-containing protein [Agrilactobacillus fermenti]MCD2256705.1 DUF1700 domain-containing protein [Agrilactobacillus fermenti]